MQRLYGCGHIFMYAVTADFLAGSQMAMQTAQESRLTCSSNVNVNTFAFQGHTKSRQESNQINS